MGLSRGIHLILVQRMAPDPFFVISVAGTALRANRILTCIYYSPAEVAGDLRIYIA